MAAEDDDHTARLNSLTSALRSLERSRSEPDKPSDPASTLPLIREPLPPLELFAPEPTPPEPPQVRAEPALRRLTASLQSNRRLIGGVCLGLVLVVGAGAGIRRLWPRLRAAVSSAPAAVATAPAAAPAAVTPTDTPPADAPSAGSAVAASTPHDVQLPAQSRSATRRRGGSGAVAQGGDAPAPASAGSPSVEGTSADTRLTAPGVAASASSAPKSAPSAPTDANATFNPGDPDVVPPAAIDAQTIIKLRPVTPGIRHEALIIAVVVDERGQVESVRAVMPPRDLGESVILMGALSSAKSWRFHPATRSGRPVKFRQIFALSDTSSR